MLRGLYTGYTGMLNEQNRLDIISNNLANSATVGYKDEGVTSQSFGDVLAVKIRDGSKAYSNETIGKMNLGAKLGEVYTNYDQGSLRQTGNDFDMAISGSGFFTVRCTDKDGNDSMKYTRNGQFKLTSDGYVVDSEGNHLQGASGDMQVAGNHTTITIDKLGNLLLDGQVTDKVKVVDFEDYNYLEKVGDTMYNAVDGAKEKATNSLVMQGYTEQSNVNVVSEMVDMITITRAYEANSKVVTAMDSMLDKAVNSVGRIG